MRDKVKTFIKNKRKYSIILIFVILVASICSLFVYKDYIRVLDKIKIDSLQIEYGDEIPKTIDSYIDIEEIHGNFDDKDFFVDVKGKNVDKDYLLAGDYQLLLTYKDEKKTIGLTVEDKTKPRFTKFKEKITITEGNKTDIEKLNSKNNYWQAEDVLKNKKTEKADIKIIGKYDYKTPGEYKLTITTTDKNGLSVEKDATVEVVKKKVKKSNTSKSGNSKIVAKSSQGNSGASKGTSGVVPPQEEGSSKSNISSVPYSGRVTSYHEIPVIRNAAENPQFAEYKELCQALYDSYIYHKSEDIYFSVPKAVDYKQLLKEIGNYMFEEQILGYNWGTGDLELENEIRCVVKVYENSIVQYETLKEIGQWVKDRGLVGIPEEKAIEKMNAYLRDNTSYDYSYQDDAYEPIGIIKNNKAVCSGYAKMVKLSCDFLGIDAKYIVGTADGANGWGNHAWNRVKIGSTWYYIDTCWNACLKSDTYYLSESLWSNHKIYQNYIY